MSPTPLKIKELPAPGGWLVLHQSNHSAVVAGTASGRNGPMHICSCPTNSRQFGVWALAACPNGNQDGSRPGMCVVLLSLFYLGVQSLFLSFAVCGCL